jgi:hypothetical protein
MPKTKKLYCYVDETGQDTLGALFIVSVVVSDEQREQLIPILEKIEKQTGKGKVKWMYSKERARTDYIKRILEKSEFKGKLYYSSYKNTREFLPRTVLTVARTVTAVAEPNYQATVFVDGLPKSKIGWFGSSLRHLHIHTKKIRGVRKEESDALMRLADAIAGFTRAAITDNKEYAKLLVKAATDGFIKEV